MHASTRDRGNIEGKAFLKHLEVGPQVSASTQNQTLRALLYLYRELMGRNLELELSARDGGRVGLTLLPKLLLAGFQEHLMSALRQACQTYVAA